LSSPTFASLELIDPLLRAVASANYHSPTPIQLQAIPPLLDGRDVLGCAQTGTGKTAAFSLPILQRLSLNHRRGKPEIRALVLTPTRELASQIGESFGVYGQFTQLRHLVVFGGVNQRSQVAELQRGIDVLVATPGRFLDLHSQGYIDLRVVEFFVLDEADRMLDMGFIRDIRKVIDLLPIDRQNLLFSATMPEPIIKLASGFLCDPVRVEVDPTSTTVESIDQQVMFVARPDKKRLLRFLLRDKRVKRAIVFTRTKHGANRVSRQLSKAGVSSAAIHGIKSQNARTRALAGFKSGEVRVLVATDIASRGIDVEGISHVFNYDLPNIAESYVHRIGRTGRAGRGGTAIAFCDETESAYLRDIEKLTGKPLKVVDDHPWHFPEAVPVPPPSRARRQGQRSLPLPRDSPNQRRLNAGSKFQGDNPSRSSRRRRRAPRRHSRSS